MVFLENFVHQMLHVYKCIFEIVHYCTCSCSVLVHFWQFLKAKVHIFPYLVEKTCKVLSLDQNKHLLYFNLREQTHLEKKLAEKENYLEGLGNQIANLSKLVCFVNHCSLIQQ